MTTKTIIIISSAVVLVAGIFILVNRSRSSKIHKNFDGIDFGVPSHLLTPNW